jgi:hypothetical protein
VCAWAGYATSQKDRDGAWRTGNAAEEPREEPAWGLYSLKLSYGLFAGGRRAKTVTRFSGQPEKCPGERCGAQKRHAGSVTLTGEPAAIGPAGFHDFRRRCYCAHTSFEKPGRSLWGGLCMGSSEWLAWQSNPAPPNDAVGYSKQRTILCLVRQRASWEWGKQCRGQAPGIASSERASKERIGSGGGRVI